MEYSYLSNAYYLVTLSYKYVLAALCIASIWYFRITIVKLFLRPNPIWHTTISKYIASYMKDIILIDLYEMKDITRTKFTSINNVPIVLSLHKMLSMQHYYEIFDREYISYYVTNECLILYIKDKKYTQEILILLRSLWNGKCLHSIILPMDMRVLTDDYQSKTLQNYANDINAVINISETNVPLFLALKHPTNLSSMNSSSVLLGSSMKSNTSNNLEIAIDNLITKWIKIMLQSDNTFKIDALINLVENRQTMLRSLVTLTSNININIDGMYVYYRNNDHDSWIRRVIAKPIYESCSNAKFLHNKSTSRTNKLLMVIVGITSIFSGYYVWTQYNNIINFYDTVSYATDATTGFVTQQNGNLSKYAKGLSQFQPSLSSKYIYHNEFNTIGKMTTLAQDHIGQVFSSNRSIKGREEFLNPQQSTQFDEFHKETTYWCNTLDNLVDTVNDDQFINYSISVKDKIKNLAKQWSKSMKYFIPVKIIKLIYGELNNLKGTNVQRSNFNQLVIYFDNLKIHLNDVYHTWWQTGNLGNRFNALRLRIKHLPSIGSELDIFMDEIVTTIKGSMKHTIQKANHPSIGDFFSQTSPLQLSEDTKQFILFINNIVSEDILNNVDTSTIKIPSYKSSQYIEWNKNVLLKILTYENKYQEFLGQINHSKSIVKNSLTRLCHRVLSEKISQELKKSITIISHRGQLNNNAYNFNQTIDLLNTIDHFTHITLESPQPYIKEIITHNIKNIHESVLGFLKNSIFTSYKSINMWNGKKDIVESLFGKPSSVMPDILENTVMSLKNLYLNIIKPTLPYAKNYDTNTYEFFSYISMTMENYTKGKKNDLSDIKDFMLSLMHWNMEYNNITTNHSSSDRFFAYHNKIFLNELQERTNNIIFKKSNKKYNELCNLFNSNLKDKVPFAIEGFPIQIEKLSAFINLYKDNVKDFKQDDKFMNTNNMKSIIHTLDNMVDNYQIKDSKNICIPLEIRHLSDNDINLNYRNKGFRTENCNYIIKYHCKTGGINISDSDVIQIAEYNMNDYFEFSIEIANSIDQMLIPWNPSYKIPKYIINNHNTATFRFTNRLGFFNFLNTFKAKRMGNDLIIRINLPIAKQFGDATPMMSNIITYIKIVNFPKLILSLDTTKK